MSRQPVTATIQRETLTGKVIGTEDGETYSDQQVNVETPIDLDTRIFILVEAPGYRDWELIFARKRREWWAGQCVCIG